MGGRGGSGGGSGHSLNNGGAGHGTPSSSGKGGAGSSGGKGKRPKGSGGAGTGGVQSQGKGGGAGGSSTPVPEPQQREDALTFTNEELAREWFNQHWPASYDYPPQVSSEYRVYSTDIGYQTMNTALRQIGGDVEVLRLNPNMTLYDRFGNPMNITAQQMYDRIKKMDEGMDFAPRTTRKLTLHRGTRWQEFQQLGIMSDGDDFTQLIGKTYTNDSFTSSSVGGKAAMSSKPVQITITYPSGMRGVYMAGDKSHGGALSTAAWENEFLIDRGTTFLVKSAKKDASGRWHLEVEAMKP